MSDRGLRVLLPAGALAALASNTGVLAQPACDCTAVVGSCTAEVAVLDDLLEIRSSREQCSRVDYFVDGLPFVALVVGGEQRAERPAGSARPNVLVQSCQVCREPPARVGVSGPAASGATLLPLIQVAPPYPEAARGQGIEGFVELELTVGPHGTVTGSRIIAAQPQGVFDEAARGSVARWRYPVEDGTEARTTTARVDFRLDRSSEVRTAAAPAQLRSTGGAPRNQCVRESAVYNLGGEVEVLLMSACQEPLLVYGCAAGIGGNRGRWVCFDSEQQRSVLVPPADARLGGTAELETSSGTRLLGYGDSFSVVRAPNSQYWWVACQATDADCNGSARQWTRSLNLQPAQVVPQHRTNLPLARSY